jgi:hypothetical protein
MAKGDSSMDGYLPWLLVLGIVVVMGAVVWWVTGGSTAAAAAAAPSTSSSSSSSSGGGGLVWEYLFKGEDDKGLVKNLWAAIKGN